MIQSLARGIEVLSILEKKDSATIGEIAEELGVDKSTASRLIQTLKEYDMVRIDPNSKKYRLGFRILYLGESLRQDINVSAIARPYMYRLCESLGESIHLASVSNHQVYIVDQVRSKKEYQLEARIGMVESWHASSVGKCILAYKSQTYTENILQEKELKKYTPHTITDPAELLKEFGRIRNKGYAIDDEERTPGVRCIAVPIFNYSGNVNQCIGLSAPKELINEKALDVYVKELKKYGMLISKELGYGMYRNNFPSGK